MQIVAQKISNRQRGCSLFAWLSSASFAIAVCLTGLEAAVAQTQTAACRPPSTREYLLLIVSETAEHQEQVRRVLPANVDATVCRYLNNTVTRVGGFPNLEVANSWARYVQDIAGLSTFVAQPAAIARPVQARQPVGGPTPQPVNALPPAIPPTAQQGATVTVPPLQRQPAARPPAQSATIPPAQRQPVAVPPPSQPQTPQTRSPAVIPPSAQPLAPVVQSSSVPRHLDPGASPQPLGAGYAVLVDYLNKPEIADQVKQLLGRNIGLVSYRQRPYLVVAHTSNQGEASSILQALNERGYWSMIVDGRRVLLVGSVVSTTDR